VYGREGMDRLGVRGNVRYSAPIYGGSLFGGAFAVHQSITAGLLCSAKRRVYVLQLHTHFKSNFVFKMG
jgi:hypothetical protein